MQTIKLATDGTNQLVRLPDEFRFDGDEVTIRKDLRTGEVTLSPLQPEKNFDEFFRMVAELTQEERDAFQIPERDRTPIRVIDLSE